MEKRTGLWIGKTGNANAWYHIYPFVASKYTAKLHIVRAECPQKPIYNNEAIFHNFYSKGKLIGWVNFFRSGFAVLRNCRIDFVVSFNLIPWATFAWFMAKLFKKPIIIGLIGSDFNKFVLNKKFWFFEYLLKHSDVVTIPGTSMKSYFDSRNFGDKIFVFPHCLPNEWFIRPVKNCKRRYDLISISELNANKRTIDILRAVSELKRRGYKLTLKILGMGPEMNALKKEIKSLNIATQVKLCGYQKDVFSHLNTAKIFVQASIVEGLSLSLVEGLGAAVVPIITEAGSERDIVSHDINGLYFEKLNIQDLSNKIEYCLNDKNYRRLQSNILKTRHNFRIEKAIARAEEIQEYIFSQNGTT